MKLKYFLRGLASGIVITTLILTISYRAKQTTNIPKEEVSIIPEASLTQQPTVEPTEIPTTEPTQESTEIPTAEPTQEPTEVPTTEPTQKPTEVPTAEPTQKPTEIPTQNVTEKKVLTITSGMWSDRVARELQAMGVVENAADFDNYLIRNGYADKIVVGTFEIPAGASYDEIARIITSK